MIGSKQVSRKKCDEIQNGGEQNQGDLVGGAWMQEAINAVELSFRERCWGDLPLPR
jgi:hypothetical protein